MEPQDEKVMEEEETVNGFFCKMIWQFVTERERERETERETKRTASAQLTRLNDAAPTWLLLQNASCFVL